MPHMNLCLKDEELKKLYREGLPMADIAKHFDVSRVAIWARIKKLGLKHRKDKKASYRCSVCGVAIHRTPCAAKTKKLYCSQRCYQATRKGIFA